MANILWRNDDISWDSDVEKLRTIQEVFEKHGQREIYSVVPFGRAIYDSDNYTHEMPLDEIENICGLIPIGSNTELVDFLKESISRGHKISLHGWQHTRVTDYENIKQRIFEAKLYLENLLDKVQYFVPPFNHYDQKVVMACFENDLTVSIGGGQLEKLIEQNLYEPHNMFWYHYWRLSSNELDEWLTKYNRRD